MAAEIRRLITRPDRLCRDQASGLSDALEPYLGADGHIGRVADRARAELDRHTAASERWEFWMISLELYGAVSEHLASPGVSRRPLVALRLWTLLFVHVDTYTGYVKLGRAELAGLLGVEPGAVSRIMSELVKCGAVIRCRVPVPGMNGPGVMRYQINPLIGTGLGGKAREAAQAAAPRLQLIDGTSHRTERRARAPSLAPVVL